jgi:hypothetical protein
MSSNNEAHGDEDEIYSEYKRIKQERYEADAEDWREEE